MKARAFWLLGFLAIGGALTLAGIELTASGRVMPERAVAEAHPVAVELFTSQGCSSCPAADAVLERLSGDRNVVALTRAVTYWDRLGWRDTLGREANTRLQQAYAARHRSNRVYTPQAVVQGGAELVGSREADLRSLVAEASMRAAPTLSVGTAPGGRTIALNGRGRGAVTRVALRSRVSVRIGNGENGGRTVTYVNVVIDERPLARWNGGPSRLAIPASAFNVRGADRYAIIVQEDNAGAILAARLL